MFDRRAASAHDQELRPAEEQKLILFLTTAQLKKMLDMKHRGQDPGTYIVDCVEKFLIEHE